MSQAFHIAVIDDHKDIRELLVRYLGEHGYRVSAAESVAAFRRQLDTSAPDLLVLDIMMPGDDGLTLCRELRAKSQVPIIFLTAMAEETDRIVGLEMGADDYLTKPFNPRELLARIKAVMRRARSLPTPTRAAVRAEKIHFEDKVLDVGRREVVEGDGVAVPLSNAEFRLLCVFLERPGVVLSRDQLLDLTSGRPAEVWDRSIDNQVSRLRRKIEVDPAQPALIKTCWGDGYQFVGKVRKS